MSFSTFKTDKSIIYSGNDDAITLDVSDNITKPVALNGVAITDMYYTESKNDLTIDVVSALNFDINQDTSKLDDIYTYNELFLKKSLAYKQLVYFYRRFNDGVDSESYSRLKHYEKLYNSLQAKFSKLSQSTGNIPDISNTILYR